jgi:hypothetical protein
VKELTPCIGEPNRCPNAAGGIGGHAATGGKPLIERRRCDNLATSSRWIDCGIAPLIVDHMEDETNRRRLDRLNPRCPAPSRSNNSELVQLQAIIPAFPGICQASLRIYLVKKAYFLLGRCISRCFAHFAAPIK